jgi:uncharacterized protein (TIGR02588 family)
MAAKKPAKPSLRERTPITEWVASALGLLLTLAVLGYSVWEGLGDRNGPPALFVERQTAKSSRGGFVVPVTVKNASAQTASEVEIRGVLTITGQPPEERRATFAYVPGRGEAKGGLVFQGDPAAGRLELTVEGFEEP